MPRVSRTKRRPPLKAASVFPVVPPERIRFIDLEAKRAVDCLCYDAADPSSATDVRHTRWDGTSPVARIYLRNSGEMRLGRNNEIFGQTITRPRTTNMGISMRPVSLMASRMRMPAMEQAINRQSP